jgi:hypothetical protein
MFRSSTILRELVWSLAKVTLHFVLRLCGAVAACLESDMLCAVQNGTEWRVCCVLCRMGLSDMCVVCCAQHTTPRHSQDMLPQPHIT